MVRRLFSLCLLCLLCLFARLVGDEDENNKQKNWRSEVEERKVDGRFVLLLVGGFDFHVEVPSYILSLLCIEGMRKGTN